MTCKYFHTEYQPDRHQWKCPSCGAGPDDFVIESSLTENCTRLHELDVVGCYKCHGGWTGNDVAEKMDNRFEIDSVEYVVDQMHQCPQVQYDLMKQLTQLIGAATKLGLYDAAEYLRKVVENKS